TTCPAYYTRCESGGGAPSGDSGGLLCNSIECAAVLHHAYGAYGNAIFQEGRYIIEGSGSGFLNSSAAVSFGVRGEIEVGSTAARVAESRIFRVSGGVLVVAGDVVDFIDLKLKGTS